MQPNYYSALAPFRELFTQGNPILTYHKIGPRPRGVRLKGLYLSADRFRRQIREWEIAGFTNGALDECVGPPWGERIAVTFDDGFANVLEHAAEPLAQAGFRAMQYLVADRLGRSNEWDLPAGEVPERLMDAAQVRSWLAAGHLVGSHTLTHPHLTQVPLAQAREEISASRKRLEDQFGVAIEHFCYPYGEWNRAVRDLVVAAGYRTACTTEWGVNTVSTDRFGLKRITARYPSRNWRTLRAWFARRFRSG